MEEVTFRIADDEAVQYIVDHLREADRAEVEALGLSKVEAVVDSYKESDYCYVAFEDEDTPILLFGITFRGMKGHGFVWALGTDGCDRHPVSMVRYGRLFMDHFLSVCPILVNWCDARYSKALKWLRMIGFAIDRPKPYGVNGALFCKITAKRRP